MKKILFATAFSLSALIFAQEHTAGKSNVQSRIVKSIQNDGSRLVINDSLTLNKGGFVQINLPSGKDFAFIQQKKGGFGTKILGKAAGAIGSGAAAVGLGSGSVDVAKGAIKVINTANAIQYGADALDNIQSLPISDSAKKIAGQKMTVLGWQTTGDGYIVTAQLQKKKYEINLQEAIMANEIKL